MCLKNSKFVLFIPKYAKCKHWDVTLFLKFTYHIAHIHSQTPAIHKQIINLTQLILHKYKFNENLHMTKET